MNKERLAAGSHLSPDRSHLSPDGGGFLIAPSTAWQRMATGSGSGNHLSPDR